MKILECEICKALTFVLNDSGVVAVCCAEPMKELLAKEQEENHEKHLPVITIEGKVAKVAVGEVLHPMQEEHFIAWIGLEQGNKTQFVRLAPGQEPKANFNVELGQGAIVVYEHCNVHGLWKAQINL